MKKNQIKVTIFSKRLNKNLNLILTVKNNFLFNGKVKFLCGCTGNTRDTATPFIFKNGEVICPNCGHKSSKVITFEDMELEKEERNKEKLENLHLVLVGDDWECGLKYYGLSARLEYDDWLKIKEHFDYYPKGWSRNQELEWYFGEPSGWLTLNPTIVENILIESNLMKSENRIKV